VRRLDVGEREDGLAACFVRGGPQQGHPARVRVAHIHLRQPGPGGVLAGHLSVVPVGLDQDRGHIVPAGMAGQHADHVVSLAGAQADQADRARRGAVDRAGQLCLDQFQPCAQRRRRVIIGFVPRHPVLHAAYRAP